LTNFSSSTFKTSFTFCSVLDRSVIVGLPPSSPRSMLEPVFLKSKRWEISRFAWSTALRTSCISSSETTSNEESLAMAETLPNNAQGTSQ
jgi:hypothetical protein